MMDVFAIALAKDTVSAKFAFVKRNVFVQMINPVRDNLLNGTKGTKQTRHVYAAMAAVAAIVMILMLHVNVLTDVNMTAIVIQTVSVIVRIFANVTKNVFVRRPNAIVKNVLHV